MQICTQQKIEESWISKKFQRHEVTKNIWKTCLSVQETDILKVLIGTKINRGFNPEVGNFHNTSGQFHLHVLQEQNGTQEIL